MIKGGRRKNMITLSCQRAPPAPHPQKGRRRREKGERKIRRNKENLQIWPPYKKNKTIKTCCKAINSPDRVSDDDAGMSDILGFGGRWIRHIGF